MNIRQLRNRCGERPSGVVSNIPSPAHDSQGRLDDRNVGGVCDPELTADAQGLTAIHSLIKALDEAADAARAEHAVRSWAAEHIGATEVIIELGSRGSVGCTGIDERATSAGGSVIAVDAPSSEPARLTITCSLPQHRVTDSLRRTLIVAGRLFGAALSRVRNLEVADGQVPAFRSLSFASERAFLGTSSQAQQLTALVQRLAQSDVSVLIEGETGVGKTFVARLIHETSARGREPLRIVNTSAIPENLLESHLFGHERGAFTGANTARMGVLEAVGRGTILLDEIGELSLGSQAKLLHVLEERRFERLGSNRTIELGARVLCATNRNLDQMVSTGQFRKDLLFRISVVRLNVPPLRGRGEDLVLLANRVLADANQPGGRRVTGFTPDALDVIQAYSWPGNVRELRNAIDHAIALGDKPLIGPNDLPFGVGPGEPQPDEPDLVRLPSALAVLERRAIDASLRATKGNRLRAAELLGVSRQTLYNKLRVHKL
jgi:DNA-binding NtrC family response regulator